VRKIAVNPRNHHQFLACGNKYLKMYDASDKTFREAKEPMIPVKYERENDFVDVVFVQENIFLTASAQNNFFIIEEGQVRYYINISFSIKNTLRTLQQA